MNIAIVDDDPTLRISLKHFLHKWFGDQNLPLSMSEYDGGDEFLEALKETEFDIVFMDIFMDKRNGIDTAEEMRKTNKNIVLVFLTSSADYMPDAFSVHAFGYLLKPLLPEKLYKVMSDIKSVSVAESEPKLEVNIGKTVLTLNYSEIIYINSDSNYCLIHCTDSRRGLRYMAHIDHDSAVDVQEIFRILERFAECRKRSSALDRVGTMDKTVI